jgi:hypothetical protein
MERPSLTEARDAEAAARKTVIDIYEDDSLPPTARGIAMDEAERRHREASALVYFAETGVDPSDLPLPTDDGGPERPFREAVDEYTARHGVTKAETYRRIARFTGNTEKSVALRYSSHGHRIWRFAAPL